MSVASNSSERARLATMISANARTWWCRARTSEGALIDFHGTCIAGYQGGPLPLAHSVVKVVFSDATCTRILTVIPNGDA